MLEELVQALTRLTDAAGPDTSSYPTAIEGLVLLRSSQPRRPTPVFFRPALCLVVQGAKWALLGNQRLDYQAGQALVINVAMPMTGRVAQASAEKPFLGLILEFDLGVLGEIWESLNHSDEPKEGCSALVVDIDGPLVDCLLRMLRLLDKPEAISTLYPLLLREISYWLLAGPHGAAIAKVALANQTLNLVRVLHLLRDRFAETLRMEDLAKAAGMSPSAFHKQFKKLTLMTPLQYQKQLRLLEARRLMVAEGANVETAAFRVGYESPSQFSREYSRVFGVPPHRDVAGLRARVA